MTEAVKEFLPPAHIAKKAAALASESLPCERAGIMSAKWDLARHKARALPRRWRTSHFVLKGDVLLEYDRADSPPISSISLAKARIETLQSYKGRRTRMFRLTLQDESSHLFECDGKEDFEAWVKSVDLATCSVSEREEREIQREIVELRRRMAELDNGSHEAAEKVRAPQ
ncbi:hypothetical protein BDK51DRAFT_36561 [Blyttiomyces helicus]|uniref:PH domain-containing protein n=1 Tax=Blyttiomyces helicus TaxID=388810 RepID=A0A4P9W1B7_9FUNG|nr:hypothetical protein BDK51DRAFT_36561 [Blyttiomyces helicus]|eukprot:RKO85971.1 hypothetical protein BDK51DRAFT_36561 [Blyttiomyces helicus]